MVDPVKNSASAIKLPVRDAAVPSAKPQSMQAPSPYWGDEIYWTDPAHPHNPMMDQQGRVWSTQGIRLRENQPAFCKDETTAFGKYVYPFEQAARRSVYDPKTGKVDADRHLLRHAPPAVRRRQGQHPVLQRGSRTASAGSTRASGTRRTTSRSLRAGAR